MRLYVSVAAMITTSSRAAATAAGTDLVRR
jgi:hypothetical protein